MFLNSKCRLKAMRRDFFIYLVSGNTEPAYSGQAQQQSKACAVRKVAKHCADLEKYYFRDRAAAWSLAPPPDWSLCNIVSSQAAPPRTGWLKL